MDILYTVDGNFVPQLATGICAICENNKATDSIHFHVIEQDIPEKDKANLRQFCEKHGRDISFYPVDSNLSSYFNVDTGAWREIILARLLMASILPSDVRRILYLDGDTLCVDSLQELWNSNMGNSIIAGVIEPTIDVRRKRALKMTEDEGYINSGVLLVDLEKWRAESIEQKLIDFCRDNSEILFASDQDALNVVLKGRILFLQPKYNFANTFYIYPYKAIKKMVGACPYCSEIEFEACVKQPAIVHFLGEDRPWRKGSTHKYKRDYLHYLGMTPYRNAPTEKGWESYYKAWSLFNGVMKPFPMARLYTINHLIPLMKKVRKRQQGL